MALVQTHAAAPAIYEAVRRALQGRAFTTSSTRTQTAFRARRTFAILWIPPAVLAVPPDVYLSIALERRLHSRRIKESVEVRPGLWMHHIRIDGPANVDGQIVAWLREAAVAAE